MVLLFNAVLLLLVSQSFCFVVSEEQDSKEPRIDILKKETEVIKRNTDECKCPKYPKPTDCSEVHENGNSKSGVYTIYPKGRSKNCPSMEVYCDMDTAGGGWTVIQRRGQFGNGADYFSKNWKAYKTGFGNVKREFWLGNDNIFTLTNQDKYSVRFDLVRENDSSEFAVYESFWIEDEPDKYKLHVSDYSGDAGDALLIHNGKMFYTHDQPNRDAGVPKEGKQRKGGWWLYMFPSTSLNALNLYGTDTVDADEGITWFKNPLKIKATEIKIRPKAF